MGPAVRSLRGDAAARAAGRAARLGALVGVGAEVLLAVRHVLLQCGALLVEHLPQLAARLQGLSCARCTVSGRGLMLPVQGTALV